MSTFCHCAVQRQEGADLEVACGDVDRRADLAPLAHVLERLPVLVGVVDDEEVPGVRLPGAEALRHDLLGLGGRLIGIGRLSDTSEQRSYRDRVSGGVEDGPSDLVLDAPRASASKARAREPLLRPSRECAQAPLLRRPTRSMGPVPRAQEASFRLAQARRRSRSELTRALSDLGAQVVQRSVGAQRLISSGHGSGSAWRQVSVRVARVSATYRSRCPCGPSCLADDCRRLDEHDVIELQALRGSRVEQFDRS